MATRTAPIVFVGVTDPVGAGFVNNLARPGGHATGFHRMPARLANSLTAGLSPEEPIVEPFNVGIGRRHYHLPRLPHGY